jgi:hypothetical protein
MSYLVITLLDAEEALSDSAKHTKFSLDQLADSITKWNCIGFTGAFKGRCILQHELERPCQDPRKDNQFNVFQSLQVKARMPQASRRYIAPGRISTEVKVTPSGTRSQYLFWELVDKDIPEMGFFRPFLAQDQ